MANSTPQDQEKFDQNMTQHIQAIGNGMIPLCPHVWCTPVVVGEVQQWLGAGPVYMAGKTLLGPRMDKPDT